MATRLDIRDLEKTFVLYNQGGVRLPVLKGVTLKVDPGECVVLHGPSGAGKSTLLRCAYGNYRAGGGAIRIRGQNEFVDMVGAGPRTVMRLRRRTIGYISQFLRVVPRVAALDVVAEPLAAIGVAEDEARQRAGILLDRLNVPGRLWPLPPATFSGGEQQRVNIARGFIVDFPLLLLDEPTAALDSANRAVVIDLIDAARERGTAILGIFHDASVRDAVATRVIDMETLREGA